MSDKPKEYAPSAFPTHTCPKIDGLLRELREAQEAAKEGNVVRITYLLSDWDGRLEELRTANQQLQDAAGGYKDNRDEWMTFASTTEDELATVQDQLADCQRDLDDARSESLHSHNQLEAARHKAASLQRQVEDAESRADSAERDASRYRRDRKSFRGFPW